MYTLNELKEAGALAESLCFKHENIKLRVDVVDDFDHSRKKTTLYYRMNLGMDIQVEGNTFFQAFHTFYFPLKTHHVQQAHDYFKEKLESNTFKTLDCIPGDLKIGFSIYEMAVHCANSLFVMSHYRYLDEILEDFWLEVFNKKPIDMWCAGIVTAHGDKGYGYRNEWEEKGIPFQHGMLLYLLTYVGQIMGDRPKHESVEWVIEQYPNYLERIQKAEQKLMGRINQKFDQPLSF